jgi:hypothetical protein
LSRNRLVGFPRTTLKFDIDPLSNESTYGRDVSTVLDSYAKLNVLDTPFAITCDAFDTPNIQYTVRYCGTRYQ